MVNFIKKLVLLSVLMPCSYAYALSADIVLHSDVAYGRDAAQTFDVYAPTDANKAPVIFMIHGGAWSGGDKAEKAEFENKVAHWVEKGFIFISTNYRTLPKVRPIKQAQDVEAALVFAQQNITQWGGDAKQFILMGHSSGAHLVALVSARYATNTENGITPWLGTVSLDISGYNLMKKLTGANPSEFYKRKFGEDPLYWKMASPFHTLTNKVPPFLAVCSRWSLDACTQALSFTNKVNKLGGYGKVIPLDLSHGEINSALGKDNCYTKSIDDFFKTLSPNIALLLNRQVTQIQKNCARHQAALYHQSSILSQ